MATPKKPKPGSQAASDRRAKAEAAMRSQARSRRNSKLGFAAIITVVVLAMAGLVTFGLMRSHNGASTTSANAAVVNTISAVPAADFDSVGASNTAVKAPQKIAGTPLTEDGKPRVLYVGAEYCPYCAAERWAVVTALGRFGTFSGLSQTESGPAPEVFPDTATLSFHGSSYSSKYVAFKGYETQDTDHNNLDTLSSDDSATFTKYDAVPLTASAQTAGSIPFMDINGAYAVSGASYSPQILAGMTHEQIAKDIADPTSEVGKDVLTAANYFTAAICQQTDNQPAAVCNSTAVTTAAAGLPTTALTFPATTS